MDSTSTRTTLGPPQPKQATPAAGTTTAPAPRSADLTSRAADVVNDVGTRVGAQLGADLGKELRESALLLALALVVIGLVTALASTALLLG